MRQHELEYHVYFQSTSMIENLLQAWYNRGIIRIGSKAYDVAFGFSSLATSMKGCFSVSISSFPHSLQSTIIPIIRMFTFSQVKGGYTNDISFQNFCIWKNFTHTFDMLVARVIKIVLDDGPSFFL